MKILLKGINHRTAPIELREKLAIEPGGLTGATQALLRLPGVREGMILSTCNRVELVACHDTGNPNLLQFLGDYLGVETAPLEPHTYEYREIDAVQHLFRVGSSLDSMVVGEPQILGQIKESYTSARSIGAMRSHLERLMQATFSVAKKVRRETKIGNSPVSVASVAVDLAKKVFGSLKGRRVLLVGAGKMSELAAAQLIKQGAESILVANRTYENAVRLASAFGGHAMLFEDLYREASESDIVITSTGAQEYIFRREDSREFLQQRKNRPMLFIDIAVPRDIDPAINSVEGVFLYDIDALQSVAASHLEERDREAQRAEMIIAQEAIRYHRHVQATDVRPMILELQAGAEELRQAELRRAQSKLQSLTFEQRDAIEALTRGLMNKFLHAPLKGLKDAAEQGDREALDRLCAIFNLSPARAQLPEQEDNKDANACPLPQLNALIAC
jgi:glutamyl-tRNA reductase